MYKSADDKLIAGVCSGLAHQFNFKKTGFRIVFAVLSVFFLFPIIIYAILWIVLNKKPTKNFKSK